jgi:hypothetical protein
MAEGTDEQTTFAMAEATDEQGTDEQIIFAMAEGTDEQALAAAGEHDNAIAEERDVLASVAAEETASNQCNDVVTHAPVDDFSQFDEEQFCLDEESFPRFAPFLHGTQRYAALSGYRFSAGSFCGTPAAEVCDAVEEPLLVSGESGLCREGPRWQSKLLAAPAVNEFAARLRSGETALKEELERASRICMAETARNAAVATCRRLDLWPPANTPAGVLETDCSYEDMSAPLDVIAQRLFNDEARRERGDSETGRLARRAMTASYLVDFAHEIRVPLPPVPETYEAMMEELAMRAQEWESQYTRKRRADRGRSSSANSAGSGSQSGEDRALRDLLHGSSPSNPASPALADEANSNGCGSTPGEPSAPPKPRLVVEIRSVFDLDVQASDTKIPVYVELEYGDERYCSASKSPELDDASTVKFSPDICDFDYTAHPVLSIRVWRRPGVQQMFLAKDRLVGDVQLPLGKELEDGFPRSLCLPLSKASCHAGAVWIQFNLSEKAAEKAVEQPAVEPSSPQRFASVAAGVVGDVVTGGVTVVGAMVTGAEGRARNARLRLRKGFGTCSLRDACYIIVTEEGTGNCYYYPYATKELAERYFDSKLWKFTSRILYQSLNGVISQEERPGGPPIAYNTIRLAARSLMPDAAGS